MPMAGEFVYIANMDKFTLHKSILELLERSQIPHRDWEAVLLNVTKELLKEASQHLPDNAPRPKWETRQGNDLHLTSAQFVAKYYAAEVAATTPRPEWDSKGGESPAAFIARAYAAEIAAGTLHRRMIEDRALVKTLSNWLRTYEMPQGIDIPTYPNWNKRQLAALKERYPAEGNAPAVQEEMRLKEVERKQTQRKKKVPGLEASS